MKSIGILSHLVEKGKIHFWWKRVLVEKGKVYFWWKRVTPVHTPPSPSVPRQIGSPAGNRTLVSRMTNY
jgi:hypothetical protein